MVNWVYRVTRQAAPADHAVAASYEQVLPSSAAVEPSAADSTRLGYSAKMRAARSRSHDAPARTAVAAPGKKSPAEPAGSSKVAPAAAGPQKPAADPFDPEVFNRQFAPPPPNPAQGAAAGPFPAPDMPRGDPQNPPDREKPNGP
jgi:hypothetical protein